MALPTWIDYDLFGDYHTIEMSFVFDNEWPPILHNFGARQKEMADAVGAYWSNMVRSGDPNVGEVGIKPIQLRSVTIILSLRRSAPEQQARHDR